MAHILVTGAARGIGKELVSAAIARGHAVTATVRTGADAERLGAAHGGAVRALVMDMADPAAIASGMAGLAGTLDILVNNAGILASPDDATEVTVEEMAETFAVNAVAPLLVARACLPALRASRTAGGKPVILSVSTQMSFMGSSQGDHIAYRASKVALNKIMQGLSTSLSADGIPVLLIDPGWVRTDMGGASAPVDPRDVATGILDLADRATPTMSGRFFRYSGEERAF